MDNQLQIVLEKIKYTKEKQETSLNLSNMKLKQLPRELVELKHLKKLFLQNNELNSLPAEMGRLIHLQECNLSNNKINGLPKSFRDLKQLRSLDISKNHLSNLPKPIRFLQSLQELFINGNQIDFIPPYIGQLMKLQRLYLSNNPIKKLPNYLNELVALQILDLEGCQLTNLPVELGHVHTLKELYLADNYIAAIPKEICQLQQLELLDLNNNQISRLPAEIKQLKHLRTNKVEQSWEMGLNLKKNRFNAPQEVFEMEPQALIQYLLDLQASKKNKPLHEAKLIFIGSGYVGKTSLIRMLRTGEFRLLEEKTDGIDIHEWFINRGNDQLRIHIWDFGGQEIMHATHKFFMTSRSAYVLVINPRAEDKYGDSELDYWLKLIRSYAGNAVPIVVVINKCEVHKIDIPKGELSDKYPNIVGFVETSCKLNKGLGELRRLIRRAIGSLQHIDDLLPQSYFDIKDLLEERNDDYIPFDQYKTLCNEVDQSFEEESMYSLMNLLHDLGVMLNFGTEDRRLKGTQVLNPEWVTKGVYQVITSPKLIRKKGIITTREISKILDPVKYPKAKERFYIMDMMDRFELCYQVPDVKDTYFVPGAFPKDRPKIDWKHNIKEVLRFQYHYDVMPSSIMSRFIVKVHDFIRGRDYWRNGVVVRKGQCDALIKADPSECIIFIKIGGRGNKRELLSFIRAQFEVIHQKLSNINVRSKIPVDESGKVVLDYDNLLFHEEMGETFILVEALREKLNVKELLSGIESGQEQRKNQKVHRERTMEYLQEEEKRMHQQQMRRLSEKVMPEAVTSVLWYETVWIKLVAFIFILAALAEATGLSLKEVVASIWAYFH